MTTWHILDTDEVDEGHNHGIPKLVVFVICTAVIFFIAWTAFAKVDVVTTLPGRFVPPENLKVVQAPEQSIVKAILVSEGQSVAIGDVLFELDPTIAEADTVEQEHKKEFVSSRLERLKSEIGAVKPVNKSGDISTASGVQQRLRFERLAKLNLQLEENERQLAVDHSSIDNARTEVDIAAADRNALERRLLSIEKLVNESVTAREYRDLQDEVAKSILAIAAKNEALQSRIAELRLHEIRRDVILKEHSVEVLSSIDEQNEQLNLADSAITKARRILEVKEIRSPVAGVIQRLSIHTNGAALNPGQPLVAIVPTGSPLVVEARANSTEAGFIRKNQYADVKIDTFPFVKYGSLAGVVEWISPDADKGLVALAAEPNSLNGQVDSYAVRIKLQAGQLSALERSGVRIAPGLAVHADVITEKRTILEFLLSPISRAVSDSFRLR